MTADSFKMIGSDEQLSAMFADLAKAQGEFGELVRSKTVQVQTKDRDGRPSGSYTFEYAPLESVLDATLPALNRNGLALVQPPHRPAPGGDWLLTTVLLHRGGARWELEASIPANDWQKLGSAITYCRRYMASGVLGVAPEDDDDGNAADGNSATPVAKGTAKPAPGPKANPGPPPAKPPPAKPPETKPAPAETKVPVPETKPAVSETKPAPVETPAPVSAAEAPAKLEEAALKEYADRMVAQAAAQAPADAGDDLVSGAAELPPMTAEQRQKMQSEMKALGFSRDTARTEMHSVVGKFADAFTTQDAERFLVHLQANAADIKQRLGAK